MVTVVMVGQFAWWTYGGGDLSIYGQLIVLCAGVAAVTVSLSLRFPVLIALWVVMALFGLPGLVAIWALGPAAVNIFQQVLSRAESARDRNSLVASTRALVRPFN